MLIPFSVMTDLACIDESTLESCFHLFKLAAFGTRKLAVANALGEVTSVLNHIITVLWNILLTDILSQRYCGVTHIDSKSAQE